MAACNTDDNSSSPDNSTSFGDVEYINPVSGKHWVESKIKLPKVGDLYRIKGNFRCSTGLLRDAFIGFGRVRFLSPYVHLDCIVPSETPSFFPLMLEGDRALMVSVGKDDGLKIYYANKMSQSDVDLMVQGRKNCDLQTSGCICLFKGRTEHSADDFPVETKEKKYPLINKIASMVWKRFPDAVHVTGDVPSIWNEAVPLGLRILRDDGLIEKTVFSKLTPDDVILNFKVSDLFRDGANFYYSFTKRSTVNHDTPPFTIEHAVAAIQEMFPGALYNPISDNIVRRFAYKKTIEPCLLAVTGMFEQDIRNHRGVFVDYFRVTPEKDTGKFIVEWSLGMVTDAWPTVQRLLKEHPEARACRSVDDLAWWCITLPTTEDIMAFLKKDKIKFFRANETEFKYDGIDHIRIRYVLQ